MGYDRSIADAVCESLFDSNRLALGLLAGARASVGVIAICDRRLVLCDPSAFRIRNHTRLRKVAITAVIRIDCLRVAARDFVGDRVDRSALDLLEQYANASSVDSDHLCGCGDGLGRFVENVRFSQRKRK